jgi:MoaA/NifB/PqqE/SkfB family radical SAM enzyme
MTQLAKANLELAEREFQHGVAAVTARPTWVTLETTAVCNLKCVQCPRENPNGTLVETELDAAIFDKFEPYIPYLTLLQLHGLGEPMLADLFWQIISHEGTKDVSIVEVNSNGTLLTERNIERLLTSGLKMVNFSLDAATASTYKKIRAGNFEKVIKGIRRLVERRKQYPDTGLRMCMNMTLMVENITELPAFIELAHDIGVDDVEVWPLNARSDGVHDEWRIKRGDWEFVYENQLLSNAPALTNRMVQKAKATAERLGFKVQKAKVTAERLGFNFNLWFLE